MEISFTKHLLILAFAIIASIIDGGLGMGYGTSLTSLLLSIGVGTAAASAAVHVAEMFTTFVSGVSHFKLGNFDKKIFVFLAVPGMVGGALGAYSAVLLTNEAYIRPLISFILLILGILIVLKFVKRPKAVAVLHDRPRIRHLLPLGLVASFVDAIGGGGWGPITTPVLVLRNAHPQRVIGSVNAAEFIVATTISITFFFTLPVIELSIVLPMIIGGLVAAPLAAYVVKKVALKTLGILVGSLIILLSARTIILYFIG